MLRQNADSPPCSQGVTSALAFWSLTPEESTRAHIEMVRALAEQYAEERIAADAAATWERAKEYARALCHSRNDTARLLPYTLETED